jgi:uncharacterized protein (TIGR02186 family)
MNAARILLPLLGAATLASASPTPDQPSNLKVTPTRIEVSTFFNGATLGVEGVIPGGCRAAVVLRGKEANVELKRRGRVWGLVWMNVGDVSFASVPTAYLALCDERLCDLAPYPVRARLVIGLNALEDHVVGASADDSRRILFRELVKLREKEGLFGVGESAVKLLPRPDGALALSTALRVPARIPEGEYEVQLWSFRDGDGALLGTADVTVEQVGATRFLSVLARTHGLLFGLLAVAIALAAGLITGMVFGLGAKKGH